MKVKFLSVFAILLVLGFSACKNDKKATTSATPNAAAGETAPPPGPVTSIEYVETEFDFGEVEDGAKVQHVYKFKNTGNEPLMISNAKGSCGCTVPDWPHEPIPAGATGQINVEFNSSGKASATPLEKRVTVTANTNPPQTFLTIKGKVKENPNAPKPEPQKGTEPAKH